MNNKELNDKLENYLTQLDNIEKTCKEQVEHIKSLDLKNMSVEEFKKFANETGKLISQLKHYEQETNHSNI